MFPVTIHATNLDDAWHQALLRCFQFGHKYEVKHGSYEGQHRYEFDFVSVFVKEPPAGADNEYLVPLMPEGSGLVPPTSKEYCESYLARYLLSDEKTEQEDYTYGERLVNPCLRGLSRPDLSKPHEMTKHAAVMDGRGNLFRPFDGDEVNTFLGGKVNQVEQVVRMFAETGGGTNQATMAIGMPWDILLNDPPCLRTIDCRVRYGKLHFYVYFRSWDLYSGFPANLGGLELLKQYMVDRILEYPHTKLPMLGNGAMMCGSKGLHIYSQYMEVVEARFGKKYKEIRAEGVPYLNKMNGFVTGL